VQPSQSSALPSSHASPGSTTPFPQPTLRVQVVLHVPGAGGSHSSPHGAFRIPSPQRRPVSSVHAAEQPSQSWPLPSSHCSSPQTTPSPQPVTTVHRLLQPLQSSVSPSSHSSPASRWPLPQTASGGGSSTFTNFPRPASSGPSGSFDVQVQTLLSGS